jgi:WhiB family transcriptional regulator, redox-sensing transcriptional regulator
VHVARARNRAGMPVLTPGTGAERGAGAGKRLPALAQVSSAKTVCRRCAVNAACLSLGLKTSQEGIWGGTTREGRRAMRPRPDLAEDRAGR